MLPNPHTKPSDHRNKRGDAGDPTPGDLFYALLIHLLIIAFLVVINIWTPTSKPAPLKSIQVQLISADKLKIRKPLQQPKEKKQVKRQKPKPKTIKKMTKKPVEKPKPKKKPVVKLKKQVVTKKATPKKIQTEPDFDPFQPMVSSSDKKAVTKKKTSPDHAEVFQSQLSSQELDRYIARIQQQVQQHWRVPAESSITDDPVVIMELNRDGSVRRVVIKHASGNANLDLSLLRAIRAAAPFTLPDREFDIFRHNTIRFHPIR